MTPNGPDLVDASDLELWADRLEARPLLPRLVRRLIASTPGVTEVSVRAGEGIGLTGWDGEAKSRKSGPYVPRYSSRWEMGAGVNPGRKAQSDYRKRTKEYKAAVRSKMTFVFVTPRRWEEKSDWRERKLKENKWRDVRVLDADDVEGWLDETPAVHYWLSEQLGRSPRSAQTIGSWWAKWSARLSEPLPKDLLLAGRGDEAEKLRNLLTEAPRLVSVRSNSRDESLAFIAAVLDAESLEAERQTPCLVVSMADTWGRCVDAAGDATLVPDFEDPDVRAATLAGRHVLVPLGAGDTVRKPDVEIPRIARDEGRQALEAAGMSFEQADRRATQARQSLVALRRTLALDPRITRPGWAERPAVDRLAPLVLVGRWRANDADKAVAAAIAGCDWTTLERDLLMWAASDDPPLRRSGGQWRFADSEDAWTLLHAALTSVDLESWRSQALTVLKEPDPALDLPPEERPFANLRGANRKWSSTLRSGMAEGVALLGSLEDAQLADDNTGAHHARHMVSRLLGTHEADPLGRTWQSLAPELPLLAEAAPDTFLDLLEDALSAGGKSVLVNMFRDSEQSSLLTAWSPHTHLLWALEGLCWSEEHFSRAALALAGLAQIDPGGRLANRPAATLRTVFLPWLPRTTAGVERRVAVVDAIRGRYPDISWRLLRSVMPRLHDHSSQSHTPRFRDWRPDNDRVTVGEYVEYVSALVQRAAEDAASDGQRWAELLEAPGGLSSLNEVQRECLLGALERIEPDDVERTGRLALWNELTDTVAKHREFKDADWALPEAPLVRLQAVAARMELSDSVDRFARLFNWRPHLEGVDRRNHASFSKGLNAARREAAETVYREGGTDALLRLAEVSPLPRHLGISVADAVGDEVAAEFLLLLGQRDSAGEMAAGWAAGMAQDHGEQWAATKVAELDGAQPAAKAAFLLEMPAIPSTWKLVDDAGEATCKIYWASIHPYAAPDEHAEAMAGHLLQLGRPWAAIELLTLYCTARTEQARWRPDVELVAQALEQAIRADPQSHSHSMSIEHEVGELLDYLGDNDVPEKVIAFFEWAYFAVLDHSRTPRALFAGLAKDPSLFVELVSYAFRGDNEEPRDLDEQSLALARNAMSVLDQWRTPPGTSDGAVDSERLRAWVLEARERFAAADRVAIGDDQIGHLLSGSPLGIDGAWPAEPVRTLVEELASKPLERGLSTGKSNSRGVTTRGSYSGGGQERSLATTFRQWSETIGTRWPRTARLVRGLADEYKDDARRYDFQAEVLADEG